MQRKPRSVQPVSTKPLSSERLRRSSPNAPSIAFHACARHFHRNGASVIDISGTQFIRPTPIAPISIEPRRTACAVSRSLPICALGKICTVSLPPVLSSTDFLELLGPDVPAVRRRRRMREADALAARLREGAGRRPAARAQPRRAMQHVAAVGLRLRDFDACRAPRSALEIEQRRAARS